MKIETQCLHEGYTPQNGEPLNLPIYQSTTYRYESTAQVAQLFDLTADGHMYSRISNPTVAAVEQKIAALEGGIGALHHLRSGCNPDCRNEYSFRRGSHSVRFHHLRRNYQPAFRYIKTIRNRSFLRRCGRFGRKFKAAASPQHQGCVCRNDCKPRDCRFGY